MSSSFPVIIIRHSEIDESYPAGALAGKENLVLSENGRKLLYTLSSEITVVSGNIDYYCSPLSRASETFSILFPDVKPQFDSRVEEVDFGGWSGKTFRQIERESPEEYRRWGNSPMDFRFPGGESIREFTKRVESFADENIEDAGKPVVIVSHGGVIRFLLCYLLGLDYRHHLVFQVPRPSIASVEMFGKKGILTGLNRGRLMI